MVSIIAIFISMIFLIKCRLSHFKTKIQDISSFFLGYSLFQNCIFMRKTAMQNFIFQIWLCNNRKKNLIVNLSVRSQAVKNNDSESGLNSRQNEQYRNISKNLVIFIPFSKWLGLQGKKSPKMKTQDKNFKTLFNGVL